MISGFDRLIYGVIAFVLVLVLGALACADAFGQATQTQLRRGTETEHNTFTGAAGEATVNTTDYRLVVHDGATAGGYPHALESELVWTKSGTQAYYTAGKVAVGVVAGDGLFHVYSGSAGTVSAHGDADDLAVENSGAGGLSILVPDASNSNLYFGAASDNDAALLRYNYTNNLMQVGTNRSGGDLAFMNGAFSEAMRLDGSGNLGIGTAAPERPLHVYGGAASLVLERNANSRLLVNLNSTNVIISTDDDAGGARQLRLTADESDNNQLVLDNTGNVGVQIAAPARALHVVGGLRNEPQASPPSSPSLGDEYTDTSGAKCWYDGSAWVKIAGSGSCS